jgi:hypothetical protein
MNIESTRLKKPSFQVSSTELTKRMQKLTEEVNQSFEQFSMLILQNQLRESGKLRPSFQDELLKGKLHKQIRQMGRALKKCTQNTPTTTQQFTDTLTSRLENFLFTLKEVEEYPIEKISDALEQMFQKENIESFSVKSFLKKFKKALTNLMIHHYMNHEEAAFDLLLEHELKTLKVDYLIENKALQYLEPHKYKQYITCLNRGFNALYQDMKSYTDFSHPFFASAEKLFQNIIAKLEQSAGPDNAVLISPNIPKLETQTIAYPSFIFRNSEDFRLFDALMQNNPSADEIGFVFRTMSEVENPPTIVVKETSFRKWFNQESKYTIELNNPIKTLSNIKNQSGKVKLYTLQKQLLKATSIN